MNFKRVLFFTFTVSALVSSLQAMNDETFCAVQEAQETFLQLLRKKSTSADSQVVLKGVLIFNQPVPLVASTDCGIYVNFSKTCACTMITSWGISCVNMECPDGAESAYSKLLANVVGDMFHSKSPSKIEGKNCEDVHQHLCGLEKMISTGALYAVTRVNGRELPEPTKLEWAHEYAMQGAEERVQSWQKFSALPLHG